MDGHSLHTIRRHGHGDSGILGNWDDWGLISGFEIKRSDHATSQRERFPTRVDFEPPS
jgi:hypothetical protein